MNQEELSICVIKLEKDVARLTTKLDSKKHWYSDAPTIVAILALIFSFGTTIVSYSKAKDQEYIASRMELRSIMERLSNLPKQHAEMQKTFIDNPTITAQLSALLNAENLSLSNQADAIIDRIEDTQAGNGKILDVEYLTVANALSSSFQQEKARKLIEKGYKRSRDATTAAGALRSLAGISLYYHDANKARSYMEKARAIYDNVKYKNDPDINKNVTNATTEIQWANMEFILSNCTGSKGHLEEGIKLSQFIPASPVKEQLDAQAHDLANRLNVCR